MTKCFYYFEDKEWWTEEDMNEYFDENEDMFGSSLKFSFEVVCASESNDILKVTAVTHDGVADFRIEWNDGCNCAAGTESVWCSTELIAGFFDRIHCPESFKANGLP